MCPCAGGTPSPIARHCPMGRDTGCAATGLRRASLAVSWGFMTITGSLLAIALIGQSIRKQKGLKLKRSTKVYVRGNGLIFKTANHHLDTPFQWVLPLSLRSRRTKMETATPSGLPLLRHLKSLNLRAVQENRSHRFLVVPHAWSRAVSHSLSHLAVNNYACFPKSNPSSKDCSKKTCHRQECSAEFIADYAGNPQKGVLGMFWALAPYLK